MTTKKFILYLFGAWVFAILFYWYYLVASIDESDMLRSLRIDLTEVRSELEMLRFINENN